MEKFEGLFFERDGNTTENSIRARSEKRRKYIHFDEMLFLVPFVEGRETSSNLSSTANNEGQERSGGTS